MKWINGEANTLDWKPSPDDKNSGVGMYGTCCTEMDIWEANRMSTAYTAHPCTTRGQYRCNATQCGDGNNRYGGVCDKDGCDFNSYRCGAKNYFGQGKQVDTNSPFTVVTQFKTSDNSDNGALSEIRRFYVQNGKVIANSKVTFPSVKPYDSVSEGMCTDLKKLFGDNNDFARKGGMKSFGDAVERGVVLVMSLWDDHTAYMLWLDSDYPLDKPNTQPGISRGACARDSGHPDEVERDYPNSSVKFSNIRFGEIGSTTGF